MSIFPILQSNESDEFDFIIFAGIILWLIYQAVNAGRAVQKERAENLAGPQPVLPAQNCLVYTGENLAFSNDDLDVMLVKHFPYYRDLNETLKKHFLKRLQIFIKKKTFIIRHSEGYKEMPVLLSAAAIQITFGLPHYQLSFFKYIQVHPQEYFAENSFRVLAGHVYGSTITVAWNHFYKNYQFADGVNVGLHEMGHALYFQHLVADSIKKKKFVLKFDELMNDSIKVYDQCRHTSNTIFTKNAFKDHQEFWAESLEIFFERPAVLQAIYPSLFLKLCNLLQQNPLDKHYPLLNTNQFAWTTEIWTKIIDARAH